MALALAVLVLGGAMGLWLLSADARREIDGLATANADSTLWTLAQAEVEFLKFHNALTQAEIDAAAALPEVRRRFDVLFARIEVLRRSAGLSSVNEVAATAETLAEVQAFHEGDPFHAAGIWEQVSIRPFLKRVDNRA